jgi:hypothetical protein
MDPLLNRIRASGLSALLDTGADQTVFPSGLLRALDLWPDGEELVKGYDGATAIRLTYLVRVAIRTLPPVNVSAIAIDDVPYVILGRDVLNRYTITLDGPAGRLTVSDDPTP